MSDFSDLLQEAEKITVHIETNKELPIVDRSIRQVLEASDDLYSKIAQSGTKDIQANLLLGSKGVDLPKIIQKLETISTKKTFEPVEPVEEIDLENIFENEIQNSILDIFETEIIDCTETISKCSFDYQKAEWRSDKRKILNTMIGPSKALAEIEKRSRIYFENPITLTGNLGFAEALYATKIIEYNNNAKRTTIKPNLLENLLSIIDEFKDAKVKEMWEIIKYMTRLPVFAQGEDTMKQRYSPQIIDVMVQQAKKYLEDRYKIYMQSIINENLSQAMLGGIPGIYNLVRSFVGVRLQGEFVGLKDDKIDDRPLWPMVYFCIRSGDLPAAVFCLRKKNNSELNEIIALLEAKINKQKRQEYQKLEENIRYNYRRYIRNQTDPFKRIVYAVLGCCDVLDEHAEVAKTADDYLWLKLSLVRTDATDEHVDFNELQQMILVEYGESHYDAMNHPYLYFQMLVLTGQFESAIEFTTRISRLKVHGVHMAIALNELYMLLTTDSIQSNIVQTDPMDIKPSRRLNIARLIMSYVQSFELTSINEALNYYYLLRNLKDSNGVNLFNICASDLIVQTKEYHKMFGTLQPNGLRNRGLIDQFLNVTIKMQDIANMVTESLTKSGLFEDAVEVYNLADNQDGVLSLLSVLLAQVVHKPQQQDSLKDRLQIKIDEISERYAREGYKASANVVTTFLKLKGLSEFFDLYHNKQYPQALKILSDLKLVPLHYQELREYLSNFDNVSVEVKKSLPDILLAVMNMIFEQYQKLKSTEFLPVRNQDAAVEKQISYLREQAKVLINFTGLLPYRLPGDISSKLVQMEILMH